MVVAGDAGSMVVAGASVVSGGVVVVFSVVSLRTSGTTSSPPGRSFTYRPTPMPATTRPISMNAIPTRRRRRRARRARRIAARDGRTIGSAPSPTPSRPVGAFGADHTHRPALSEPSAQITV